MASGNLDDDDYVASLLKQDARNAAKKYEMVGLDAFLPSRPKSGALKPNTGFLRQLIRQTDNHNAALLTKEAEESRARLRRMDPGRGTARSGGRRSTSPDHRDNGERPAKRKRRSYDHNDDDAPDDRRRRRDDREDHEDSNRRRDRREGGDHRRKERRDRDKHDENEERRSKRSHHSKDKERRREYSSEEDEDRSRRRKDSSRRHRRQRSYSRSPSRSRAHKPHTSSRHQQKSRPRDRSRSPKSCHRSAKSPSRILGPTRNDPEPCSDSDPLEAIVGPLPPVTRPAPRLRGRGADRSTSTAMDARFASTYNPSTDVQIQSDVEDDWGDALEVLRDRQRWKQQGAERLKAAGFSTDQVKKWENGDEKTEDDVQWAAKGEGREWDRGKVIDADGHVDLKADWGRLK